MDKIKERILELVKQPLYAAIAGLVLGLIIGLPVLGWGLFPVEWTDADPSYLRDDLKKQYLCMVVDSYKVNQNVSLAATRLESLGVDINNLQGVFKNLEEGGCAYNSGDPTVQALKLALLEIDTEAQFTASPESTLHVTEEPVQEEVPTAPKKGGGLLLLLVLIALFLAIGGVLIYLFFFKNKKSQDNVPPLPEEEEYIEEEPEEIPTDEEVEAPEYEETPEELPEEEIVEVSKAAAPPAPAAVRPAASTMIGEPVAHFMTSYAIGDDLYDDSFSIDAPNGAFLGECGVGISDTIGVGDPKKVTAFEVWLFDKNDIQTVTKVLMSAHAMNDAAIKQRLASKGEPVLLEPGQQFLLETATLQLEARVIEMVYGQGALPAGSFIERLTLELSVWPK